MKLGDSIVRSLRSLANAKIRTLLTALALAVGGFTLTLTLAAANGARDYTDRLVSDNFDPQSLVVVKDKSLLGTDGGFSSQPKAYDESQTTFGNGFTVSTLNQADLDKIAALPEVSDVFVDYQQTLRYVNRVDDPSVRYTGTIASYNPNLTQTLAAGSITANLSDSDILVPESYIQPLGYDSATAAIGQQLTIVLNNATERTFTIRGVIQKPVTNLVTTGDSLFVSADAARALYLNANNDQLRLTTATVRAAGGSDEASINSTKQALERAGYGAQTVADTQQLIGQVIDVLQIIILVFGAITLVASFFGVVNTQYISVLERTREIGLMKALGMSRAGVSRLFVLEATWIGFLGAVLGAVGAVVAGTLLNPTISNAINFGDSSLLIFDYRQIGLLILFLMAVTTIAGLLPARKAAKLNPIVALRTE